MLLRNTLPLDRLGSYVCCSKLQTAPAGHSAPMGQPHRKGPGHVPKSRVKDRFRAAAHEEDLKTFSSGGEQGRYPRHQPSSLDGAHPLGEHRSRILPPASRRWWVWFLRYGNYLIGAGFRKKNSNKASKLKYSALLSDVTFQTRLLQEQHC